MRRADSITTTKQRSHKIETKLTEKKETSLPHKEILLTSQTRVTRLEKTLITYLMKYRS